MEEEDATLILYPYPAHPLKPSFSSFSTNTYNDREISFRRKEGEEDEGYAEREGCDQNGGRRPTVEEDDDVVEVEVAGEGGRRGGE